MSSHGFLAETPTLSHLVCSVEFSAASLQASIVLQTFCIEHPQIQHSMMALTSCVQAGSALGTRPSHFGGSFALAGEARKLFLWVVVFK